MTIHRLSILGYGLLGGSIARAVSKNLNECQIKVYDLKLLPGPVVSGCQVEHSAARACVDADLIVICVPPASVASLLREISQTVKPEAVITDVTSVKRSVLADAQALLRQPQRFVGSHPMAGGERSGSAASRADLFEGSTVVVTPLESTDRDALESVETFWQALGAATLRMSAQDHDRAVAEISHLPHLLASLLMHVSDPASRAIAGPGFKDLTRVATGNPIMWQQILSANGDELRRAIQHMEKHLHEVEALLDPSREAELREWLSSAAAARQSIAQN